jgi:antitoxin ParD1/3/4
MNVTLPPDLEQFVNAQLAAGTFASAEDVIQEGLRLLRRREELRSEIAVGLAEAENGQLAPMSAAEILAEVRQRRSS